MPSPMEGMDRLYTRRCAGVQEAPIDTQWRVPVGAFVLPCNLASSWGEESRGEVPCERSGTAGPVAGSDQLSW